MKFEEVLPMLRSGKKIRRAEWIHGVHLCIIDGEVLAVDTVVGVQSRYALHSDDLLADDWMVMDE